MRNKSEQIDKSQAKQNGAKKCENKSQKAKISFNLKG
jgi:hypothetical protein